jgi:predicted ATP-grasp superfamily ATP-dependent carboligase
MIPIILRGKEAGLGYVRSLGIMNIKSILIYCSKKDEIARLSKYVSKAYKCPLWSKREAVKDFLIKIKDDFEEAMLIPTDESEIKTLAKFKAELSKYYTVPVPDYNIIKLFVDKKEAYKIAEKAGIDFPLTFYPDSIEDALTYTQGMQFPLIIKPRARDKFFSVFDKKLFIVNNNKELNKKLRLCLEHNIKIMITEIIPGPDTQIYEYNFYIDKSGEITAGLCHVKLRQFPPNYGSGRVIKTVINKEVEELTKRFLKDIPGFFGPGQLEFKFDTRDKKYKFIEMNGRMGQQNELFAEAGINFANLFYQEWSSNKSSKIKDYNEDFYHIHFYFDLIFSILSHNEENYSLIDYIKPYFKKPMFAIESLTDPKPMILYWSQKAKSLPELIRKTKYR